MFSSLCTINVFCIETSYNHSQSSIFIITGNYAFSDDLQPVKVSYPVNLLANYNVSTGWLPQRNIHNLLLLPLYFQWTYFAGMDGFEPTTNGLTVRCATAAPHTHIFKELIFVKRINNKCYINNIEIYLIFSKLFQKTFRNIFNERFNIFSIFVFSNYF